MPDNEPRLDDSPTFGADQQPPYRDAALGFLSIDLMDRLRVALATVPLERDPGPPTWLNDSARRLLSRFEGPLHSVPLLEDDDRDRLIAAARSPAGRIQLPLREYRRLPTSEGGDRTLEVRAIPIDTPSGRQAVVYLDAGPGGQFDEAAERYEALLRQAPEPIGVHRNGEILFANQAAAELFGFDHPDEFVGETVIDYVHPDDREMARDRMQRVAEGQEVDRAEERLLDADDEIVYAEVTAKRVEYEGEPATQIALRDVTDRKESERERAEQLRERRRVTEDMEAIADAVGHDLRVPLNTVSRYLQRIRGRVGEDAKPDVDAAADAVDRMRSMLDGVLAVSRVSSQEPNFEPVDLTSVVSDALADLESEIEDATAGVRVGDLSTVRGDRAQLCRVFENLVSNAIEYAGEGSPEIAIREVPSPSDVVVEVADQGEGMTPDEVDRALERFEQIDETTAGHGLGLSLCQRIVDRHEGDLSIRSEPGEGTVVRLTLLAPEDDG